MYTNIYVRNASFIMHSVHNHDIQCPPSIVQPCTRQQDVYYTDLWTAHMCTLVRVSVTGLELARIACTSTTTKSLAAGMLYVIFEFDANTMQQGNRLP